jgi:hypothetical protein
MRSCRSLRWWKWLWRGRCSETWTRRPRSAPRLRSCRSKSICSSCVCRHPTCCIDMQSASVRDFCVGKQTVKPWWLLFLTSWRSWFTDAAMVASRSRRLRRARARRPPVMQSRAGCLDLLCAQFRKTDKDDFHDHGATVLALQFRQGCMAQLRRSLPAELAAVSITAKRSTARWRLARQRRGGGGEKIGGRSEGGGGAQWTRGRGRASERIADKARC